MHHLTLDEIRLRQFLTRYFLEQYRTPTAAEAGKYLGLAPNEVTALLDSLAAKKGLVLHPHIKEPWIVHPFSGSPNTFYVEDLTQPNRGWWSNCSWCALGVAALARRDVRIVSRLGGEHLHVELQVRFSRSERGVLVHNHEVVHMPIPVPRLWDNVLYSCSLMLLHKDRAAVADWCERHAIDQGSVIPVAKCWELAQAWYGPYLDAGWNRRSGDEIAQLFAGIGLDLDFRMTQ